jgi:hypothetical protein
VSSDNTLILGRRIIIRSVASARPSHSDFSAFRQVCFPFVPPMVTHRLGLPIHRTIIDADITLVQSTSARETIVSNPLKLLPYLPKAIASQAPGSEALFDVDEWRARC